MTEARELKRLAAELDHGMRGTPWHGNALTTILEGVTADVAFAHPIAGAHSIWELVLHITAWTHETTHRLRGGVPGEPGEGDWPAAPLAPSESQWGAAQTRMIAAHEALLATIARLDPAELDAPPIHGKGSMGTGVKHRVLVHGLAQHHAYHGGQIALLRRAAQAPATS
ncbi:MAG: DinB family protein [Gemmatimonadetes bacterium]|nr:DinB family protein [Gemmatimonadota bacterium]